MSKFPAIDWREMIREWDRIQERVDRDRAKRPYDPRLDPRGIGEIQNPDFPAGPQSSGESLRLQASLGLQSIL